MPGILVNVGNAKLPELELVLSDSQIVSPFATFIISHCWGEAQIRTTTIATIV
jgi:hypothetical protein